MPPANNNLINATVISGHSGTVTVDTVGATLETGEASLFPTRQGHSVWYKWTADADGFISIDTSQTPMPLWDSTIDVFTGSDLDISSLALVQANSDGFLQEPNLQGGVGEYSGTDLVHFAVMNGTTYYIRVDNWVYTETGTGTVFTDRSDGVLRWAFHLVDITTIISGYGQFLIPGIGTGEPWDIQVTDNTLIAHIYIGDIEAAWDADPDHIDVAVMITDDMAGSWTMKVVDTSGNEFWRPTFVLYPGPWVQADDATREDNQLGHYNSVSISPGGGGGWSQVWDGTGDRTEDEAYPDSTSGMVITQEGIVSSRNAASFDLWHIPLGREPILPPDIPDDPDAWAGPQYHPTDVGELRWPMTTNIRIWNRPIDLIVPTGPNGISGAWDSSGTAHAPTGYPGDASFEVLRVPESEYTIGSGSNAIPHFTGGSNWKSGATMSDTSTWIPMGGVIPPVSNDFTDGPMIEIDWTDITDADTNGEAALVIVTNYYLENKEINPPDYYGLSAEEMFTNTYSYRPPPYRMFYPEPYADVGWVVGALAIG